MTPMRPSPPPRAARARRVVLAILLTNLGWVVALPVLLTDPPRPTGYAVLAVLLALLAATYAGLLWAAVTPDVPLRTRGWRLAALLAATLALWPACFGWAETGQEPWAWLAGFAIGVGPLVLPWRAAAAVGAGVLAATVIGALRYGQSVPQHLLITLGIAAVVIAMAQVTVWLLRLLVAAEAGREAEAALAVSQERLRLARDLHDVLGHRLGLIALQAEVAGAEDIRALAGATLQEVRQAVHGYGTVDVTEQLETARLVLASAGIQASVTAAPPDLGPATSQLVAATVREAITNVLRHSDARQVRIELTRSGLLVSNDGLRATASAGGLGLAGLAERAAQAGAMFSAGPTGDRFEVRLELAPP
jgi:two-component system sensor histidine kinase DesK